MLRPFDGEEIEERVVGWADSAIQMASGLSARNGGAHAERGFGEAIARHLQTTKAYIAVDLWDDRRALAELEELCTTLDGLVEHCDMDEGPLTFDRLAVFVERTTDAIHCSLDSEFRHCLGELRDAIDELVRRSRRANGQ